VAPHRKLIVVNCLILIVFVPLVGCNRGNAGGSSPAAAAKGAKEGDTKLSGGATPATPRPSAADRLHPVVTIQTSLGNITLRLDAEKAPLTVDNFLSYVNAAFYDQTIVHQVYKGQGWVAGGYGTNGLEKPGRTPIRNEAQNGLKNRRGTVAMVRRPDAIDSATTQFFVNFADNASFDYKDRTPGGYGYCVFGEVIEGMEVVDKINGAEVRDTADFERIPVQPIVIASIRRIK
jgi:cyclophilin family peptidyl-prolyl cis-trans isomerase